MQPLNRSLLILKLKGSYAKEKINIRKYVRCSLENCTDLVYAALIYVYKSGAKLNE